MPDRCILMFSADHHAGHMLALLNPNAVLFSPDGYEFTPALHKTQEYMWEDRWVSPLRQIYEWAAGDPVHVKLAGDLGQGYKHKDEWIAQTDFDSQATIIRYNLEPLFWYKNLEAVEIAIGTGAHNFGKGGLEVTAARLLRAEHPEVQIDISYHSRTDVHGCMIDCAHHGPWPGGRVWLEGNGARYYLRDAMQKDYNYLGKEPSKIYLRGHYHYQICERVEQRLGGKLYESWLVEVPSLTGLGDFAHKATRSTPIVNNGICAIEVIDGEPRIPFRWYTKMMDTRTERSYG